MGILGKSAGKKQGSAKSSSGQFLAVLTQEERVAVSNLSLVLYHTIIGEKEGGSPFALVTDDINTEQAVPLLRKLTTADLNTLIQALEACIQADRLANQGDMAGAAPLYKKTFDLNPYHDLAVMSYGTALANQGNLREGIKWVEKAVKINPKNERAKRNLQAMKNA